MNHEIVVVTKVPEGDEVSGNLAVAFDLYWDTQKVDEKTYLTKVVPLVDALEEMLPSKQHVAGFILSLRAPVFKLGEILFLDDSGREISPAHGARKPDKWSIHTETVDSLEEALALSWKVCHPEEAEEQAAVESIKQSLQEEA